MMLEFAFSSCIAECPPRLGCLPLYYIEKDYMPTVIYLWYTYSNLSMETINMVKQCITMSI